MRIRKEIHTLTPSEVSHFLAAIKQLHADKNSQGISKLDEFVKMHLDIGAFAHGSAPPFLPWHRFFVFKFEQELQRIDSSITIPYWNWSMESQNPAQSIVFRDDYFGGNGDSTGCIASGPFSNFHVYYPKPHCLWRDFDQGNEMGPIYAQAIIESLIKNATDYDPFRKAIESGPHASLHVNMGGDMSQMFSPYDPIFWLHHAFIDKIWNDFQRENPDNLFKYDKVGDPSVNLFNPMRPFGVAIYDAMDISTFCYSYEDFPKKNTFQTSLILQNMNYDILSDKSASKELSILTKKLYDTLKNNNISFSSVNMNQYYDKRHMKLYYPSSIPYFWLHHMNIPENDERILEYYVQKMYDILNDCITCKISLNSNDSVFK